MSEIIVIDEKDLNYIRKVLNKKQEKIISNELIPILAKFIDTLKPSEKSYHLKGYISTRYDTCDYILRFKKKERQF